jgi:hypothetical protein
MKLYLRLILSGALLIALAFTFAACSGGAQVEPSPVAEVTEAPVVATKAPTEVAAPVLEIVGLTESKSLTMDELKGAACDGGICRASKAARARSRRPLCSKAWH